MAHPDFTFEQPRAALTLAGHAAQVGSVDFHPTGRWLVSGGGDCEVRVWDLQHEAPSAALVRHDQPVIAVRFHPGGELIASLDAKGVVFFCKFPELTVYWSTQGYVGNKGDIRFSPDGRYLAVGGRGGRVQLLEIPGGKKVLEWQAHEKTIQALAFHPVGGLLATGGADGKLELWEIPEGTHRATMEQHNNQVLTADFHPSGQYIATGSVDKMAFVWDHTTDEIVREYHIHAGFVTACRFHPQANVLSTASNDSTQKFWDFDAPGPRMIGNLKRHDWTVHEICFSPAGFYMASASTDEQMVVWDLRPPVVSSG